MKKKIIAAGHICLDVAPIFADTKTRSIAEIMQPGKTVEVGTSDVHTGGSVANTGLALKIFGNDVRLLAKVGQDAFGELICNLLKEYNAAEDILCLEQESTAYTIVISPPGIDRIFLHHQGANKSFLAKDISQEMLEDAALLHFGYPTVMESMYRENGRELIGLMQRVQASGCATSLDLCGIDANSPSGRTDWDAILRKTLPYVDFFVPSIEELCFILDRDRLKKWQEKAGDRDITEVIDAGAEASYLAEKCISYGAKVVMIKCGVPGIYLQTADREKMRGITKRLEMDVDAWSKTALFERSFVPDQFLSGTGAGDASIGGFLTAVLKGCRPEKALTMATAAGACCVTQYDAVSGLLSYEQLEEKIASGWKKQK